MHTTELEELFERYLDETISPEDLDRLWQTLEQPGFREHWQRFVDRLYTNRELHGLSDRSDRERALLKLKNLLKQEENSAASYTREDPTPVHRIRPYRWVRVAAAVLILTGGIYWWQLQRSAHDQPPAAVVATPADDISPGQDGAILTLDDGTQLVLDSAENGLLAMQNGARVILQNGRLLYDRGPQPAQIVTYNTMTTPKGRQFRMELPDGTRVWLNAASSVRYPTAFPDRERKVEITGEVYFEVAENKNAPFIVQIPKRAEIEVLGTHFNINAYEGEPSLNTTLLEGSVRVRALEAGTLGSQSPATVTLQPHQQAQVRPATSIAVMDNVNIEKIMAWKNGLFNFEGTNLKEMFRQLERWYDIQVVYEGEVPDIQFFGKMSKNMQLQDVLSGLREFGIRFRIEEGKKLVIMQ